MLPEGIMRVYGGENISIFRLSAGLPMLQYWSVRQDVYVSTGTIVPQLFCFN